MSKVSRRQFVAATAAVGVSAALPQAVRAADKPAVLGGKPVRTKGYPGWPIVTPADESSVRDVVRTGRWYRHQCVDRLEEVFAQTHNSRYCVAVSSGTSALYASLGALGIGPGDEVIVPPYTFVATVNVVLQHFAMPVFVDSDRETFLMDSAKVEAAITERTAAIIPVHIGGSPADLDSILAIAKRHSVPVIEDACQAVLGRWRDRGVGSWGTSGCFSFQLSKNVSSGEGGAILTNDETMANNCYAFHNCCRKRPGANANYSYRGGRSTNARMTEFQGAVLLSQLQGAEQRAQTRSENGLYLASLFRDIPGISVARTYENCTRNAYHLFMFRYKPDEFAGLSRSKFIKALRAEGIPCSDGYHPLNKETYIQDALQSRTYMKVYGKSAIERWVDRNQCPENDKLCDEAVWFSQNMLLGPRTDMDEIAEAVRKIKRHAAELRKV